MVRILIVEDENLIALHTKIQLQMMGYEVTGMASTGVEALKMIEEDLPDLILMDQILQDDLTGVETVKLIHERNLIPVIYTTALSDESTLEEIKATKLSSYLFKPFDSDQLQKAIEKALEKWQTIESRPKVKDHVPGPKSPMPVPDPAGLAECPSGPASPFCLPGSKRGSSPAESSPSVQVYFPSAISNSSTAPSEPGWCLCPRAIPEGHPPQRDKKSDQDDLRHYSIMFYPGDPEKSQTQWTSL